MAKKKIKASKSKKQGRENKYFLGALLTIGGLFVIGIAAVILFGSGGASLVSGSGGHDVQIQNDIESKHGAAWRGLGVTDWQYSPTDSMIYVDTAKWANLSVADEKKRMNQVGKDFGKIIGEHGGDAKAVYLMFHDSANRNTMVGTYSGASGAQIQQ